MVKAIKFCYLASVPLFLAVLLYYYAFLPEEIALFFDKAGVGTFSLAKSNFFYLTLGLFIVTNGVITLYRQLAQTYVNQDLIDFADMNLQESLYHWVQGLSLMFNLLYVFSIVYLGLYYSKEGLNISSYNALVYLGPIFIVGWIFWLFYLLISKK